MKKSIRSLALSLTTFMLAASPLCAANVQQLTSVNEPLDTVNLENSTTLHLSVGIGSGAFRLASDPEGVFYTITDRGPNIDAKVTEDLLGKKYDFKSGKIFPTPNFAPTIYRCKLVDDIAVVEQKIQLKTTDGMPISGISNPETEVAYSLAGNRLQDDPAGVDAEAIIKLADGTFWIGEEYGPSLLHIAADGRVINRLVPKGVAASLQDAGYPVVEALPEIIRHRPLNRGIESIAVSPDEKFLYFALQSPLALPDKAAYKAGKNVRLFTLDREKEQVVAEYVYQLDDPDTFVVDNSKKKQKQNAVKVSEMTAVGMDTLVVLERISKTTKFYKVDLSQATSILNSKWDSVATSPSLEQQTEIQEGTLHKHLLLNSDDNKGIMKKIEGLAWFGGNQWLMVNDNDFGIAGDATKMVKVSMEIE
ncbi:esterase-like activity of phytase family protein [Desulfogranum japonicum]|uniref:esterase-like activity of phytase family protein n=1 Tax=Desulfogranum japonicum TaxID=231447 RepID=UPI0003F59AF2|nr:esterase-like activity of phytase family protein [Desulfogranum japonicum]